MAQGPLDHPSYLARVQLPLGKTTAGNATVTNLASFTNNQRIRNVSAFVTTAGTATGNLVRFLCIGTCTTFTNGVGTQGTGTTTLGSAITLSTSTAGVVGTSGDLNAVINAGSLFCAQNGTDATGVVQITAETHLDPLGTWVVTNNG